MELAAALLLLVDRDPLDGREGGQLAGLEVAEALELQVHEAGGLPSHQPIQPRCTADRSRRARASASTWSLAILVLTSSALSRSSEITCMAAISAVDSLASVSLSSV